MFPNLETRKVKRQLSDDDIDGATALYGPRTFRQSPQHEGDEEFTKLPHSGHTALVWSPFTVVFLKCFSLAVVGLLNFSLF